MNDATDRLPPRHLVAAIVSVILIALALRAGLGPRWFSFYGVATVALVILPFAAHAVLTAHRRRGWRRWPVWILTVMTAAAILMQIGFWLTFFHGGGAGLGLGIVRSMFQSLIEIIAATISPALVVIWLLLIFRISR